MDRKNKDINQRNLFSLIDIKHQIDSGAYDSGVLLQHLLVHFENLNKEYNAVCEQYSALQDKNIILENECDMCKSRYIYKTKENYRILVEGDIIESSDEYEIESSDEYEIESSDEYEQLVGYNYTGTWLPVWPNMEGQTVKENDPFRYRRHIFSSSKIKTTDDLFEDFL